MSDNLTLIRASNTRAILNQGKKLKFVGEGVEFKAYQNGNDSVLTLKNSNIQLPTQQDAPFNVEIQEVAYTEEGRTIYGKLRNGYPGQQFKFNVVNKLGQLIREIVTNGDGRFQLSNINPGIYTLINSSNPSMKTDIVITEPDELDINDPANPENPIYDLIKSRIPVSYDKLKFPETLQATIGFEGEPDVIPYEVVMDRFHVHDLSYGIIPPGENSTIVTIYNVCDVCGYIQEFATYFRYYVSEGVYVQSNSVQIYFPLP